MHLGIRESVALARGVSRSLRGQEHVPEVAVFPSFTALSEVHKSLARSRIAVGAQQVGVDKQGAYTGEVSPAQLEDVGCRYALVGHSERRWQFEESDALVRRRLQACLRSKITPVLCVGETTSMRETGEQEVAIREQLRSALGQLGAGTSDFMVAYEPVWAIGSGETASVAQVIDMHAFIRSELSGLLNGDADEVPILYGGSVRAENAYQLLREREVDGVLVGGASLKIHAFGDILEAAIDVVTAQRI